MILRRNVVCKIVYRVFTVTIRSSWSGSDGNYDSNFKQVKVYVQSMTLLGLHLINALSGNHFLPNRCAFCLKARCVNERQRKSLDAIQCSALQIVSWRRWRMQFVQRTTRGVVLYKWADAGKRWEMRDTKLNQSM